MKLNNKKLIRIFDLVFVAWLITLVILLTANIHLDRSFWKRVATAQEADLVSFDSMAVYRNALYAGAENLTEGATIKKYDGLRWQDEITGGFGNIKNTSVKSLVVYNNDLYAGTTNNSQGLEVWRYDGYEWSSLVANGWDDGNNTSIMSMEVFGGKLFLGTYNDVNGAQIWSYDGTNWEKSLIAGRGNINNVAAASLKEYNGKLYAGVVNEIDGAEIWIYDGISWELFKDKGFGDVNNIGIYSMEEYKDDLYFGVRNDVVGGQVWKTNSETGQWVKTSKDGFMLQENVGIMSMQTYGNYLYVGTLNVQECPGGEYPGFSKIPHLQYPIKKGGYSGAASYIQDESGEDTEDEKEKKEKDEEEEEENTPICHRTLSETDPYAFIEVDAEGVADHMEHEGDIIPIDDRDGDGDIDLDDCNYVDEDCGCGEVWRTDGTELVIPEFSTYTLIIAFTLSCVAFIMIRLRMRSRMARV